MKSLNKKGFTLVELLAVIVVLAIIMIIAIPQVMDSMNNAKKNSLIVEARKVVNKVAEKVQMNSMEGKAVTGCFKISSGTGVYDVNIDTGGKYTGSVNVAQNGTYTVYLVDKDFEIYGVSSKSLEISNVNVRNNTDNNKELNCGV